MPCLPLLAVVVKQSTQIGKGRVYQYIARMQVAITYTS
jgi:hypothetical protein